MAARPWGLVMRPSAAELWAFMHPREEPWTPEMPEEYHGVHVKSRRRGCAVIEWRRCSGPSVRFRVQSHTCECLATVYELGAFGGRYLIRRTTRGPGKPVVHESPRMLAYDAGELWSQLLVGLAR